MTLSVNNINLFYGASHCLRGVTLGAVPGSITCVLGRNGVGKSSLMRSIMGLERVRSGSIMWEGRDITTLAPAERARAGIAMCPRGGRFFLSSPCAKILKPRWPRHRAGLPCPMIFSTFSPS